MINKITHTYKKNKKVELIETGYLNNSYYHHVSGCAKIVRLIDSDEWKEPYVPEYEVEMDNNTFIIPQYSIQGEIK